MDSIEFVKVKESKSLSIVIYSTLYEKLAANGYNYYSR